MKKTLLFFLISFSVINVIAQEDVPNCKDHKFFTRMPNYFIVECSENFNAIDFLVGKDKSESIEGNITKIMYQFHTESGAKVPSQLQVVRNYENAITKNGGKKVYIHKSNEGGIEGETFTMSKDGKEYWVQVHAFAPGMTFDEVAGFELVVLEKEPMKQDIEASAMFEKLNKEGSVALYINFETGKSTIKPESAKIVEEIATMLKSNPALKVSIEGHTDNVGTPAANKTLSDSRAKAVMSALIAKGIEAARLTAKGWGQDKPVADNATEDGKAKNRRVEIVKK